MDNPKNPDPRSEKSNMRRLREIDLKLYNEIINVESDLYTQFNAKLAELREVKDLILALDKKAARRRLSEIKEKNDPDENKHRDR